MFCVYFESVTMVDREPFAVVSVMLVIGDKLVETFGITVADVVVVKAPLPLMPDNFRPLLVLPPSVDTQLFTAT